MLCVIEDYHRRRRSEEREAERGRPCSERFVQVGGVGKKNRVRKKQLALEETPSDAIFHLGRGGRVVRMMKVIRGNGKADTVGGTHVRRSAAEKKLVRPSCTRPPRGTWLSRLPMRRQPRHEGGGERGSISQGGSDGCCFFFSFFYWGGGMGVGT